MLEIEEDFSGSAMEESIYISLSLWLLGILLHLDDIKWKQQAL